MGLMQGKVMNNTLVIMDSFALPVQGTETRVNAANEANEYMVEYVNQSEKVRRVYHLFGYPQLNTCHLRLVDWRTQLDGTILIRDTDAGFLALM